MWGNSTSVHGPDEKDGQIYNGSHTRLVQIKSSPCIPVCAVDQYFYKTWLLN